MDTCVSMAESLHCSPETITTLLASYTPIQNKKLNKKDIFTYVLRFHATEYLRPLPRPIFNVQFPLDFKRWLCEKRIVCSEEVEKMDQKFKKNVLI